MYRVLADDKLFMVVNEETAVVIADRLTRKAATDLTAELEDGSVSEHRARAVYAARKQAAFANAAGRAL